MEDREENQPSLEENRRHAALQFALEHAKISGLVTARNLVEEAAVFEAYLGGEPKA